MSGGGRPTAPSPPEPDDHGAEIPEAALTLVARLTAAGRTVAVAESLTGGAVTEALVAVPGASRCLRGGVVAYATDLKASLLGVPQTTLGRHGAVHPDVALAMAGGVRERLGADYGLATTGVAGPEPQDGQAPGTFHVAVVGPGGSEVVSVDGGRGPVRSRTWVRRDARDTVLALALRGTAELVNRGGAGPANHPDDARRRPSGGTPSDDPTLDQV